VPATPWTLDGELCAIGGSDDLATALAALGLIPNTAAPFEVVTTQNWYQAGAETYILLFEIRRPDGVRGFVVKACVSVGKSLKETVVDWVGRRTLLNELGVATPALVGVNGADIVEEYIPHELLDALSLTDSAGRSRLLANLGRTAGLLVRAGFAPLSAHDWRSRGDDVVLIDFGQDLGPADFATGSESGLLSELTDRIARRPIELTPAELQVMVNAYEAALTD
jgi:hypothetical protein